ncbi:MAG: aminomethyltransferase beta-barrel domain-containing protein, partial [Verrucomicrobiota bacterium]
GDIVHLDGRVLGRHDGIIHYTIGQRRGLGIGGGMTDGNTPLFVVRIDPEAKQVVVGPREALEQRSLRVSDLRWTAGRVPQTWPLRCAVQIRHHAPAAPAWVAAPDGAGCAVDLDSPAVGVAPGQAAVFYDGDRVVGGGWIAG